MATRTNTTKTLNDITPLDALVAMFDEGDNPQEDNPVNLTSVALHLNLSDADTFKLLDTIADISDVINGKGTDWWFTSNYADVEAMSNAYSEAMEPHTRKGKPVAKKTAAKPVQPAVEPVKAADGTTVTVPVSEGSTERRELDASKGERVISEDKLTDLVQSLKVTIPAAFDGKEYESDIEKHGLALDEPDFIPAMTDAAIKAGVSENEWYMMYAALTQTARDWWTKRVSAKIEAHDTNSEPEKPVEPTYSVAPATKDEAGF